MEGTVKADQPRHQQDIITPKKWRQFASLMRRGRKFTNISKRGLGNGWRKWSMSCSYSGYWSGIPRRLNNGRPEASVCQRSCWLIFYFCFGKGLLLFWFLNVAHKHTVNILSSSHDWCTQTHENLLSSLVKVLSLWKVETKKTFSQKKIPLRARVLNLWGHDPFSGCMSDNLRVRY